MASIGPFTVPSRDTLPAAAALQNQTHSLHSAQQVQESIAQRIGAVEIAERHVSKREQLVAVREVVLRQALAAVPRGGKVQEREQEIHDMVLRAAATLPPPVSVAGFVQELEERAVELECALHNATQQALAAAADARAVVAMKAGLQRREEELEAKAIRHQEVWRELRQREALQATRARELEQYDAELQRWAARLRETEKVLQEAADAEGILPLSSAPQPNADQRTSLVGDRAHRATLGADNAERFMSQKSEGERSAPLGKSLTEAEEEARASLVEVATYLSARHAALRDYEAWVVERAAAVESTLQLLDSVFSLSEPRPTRPAPPLPAERSDNVADVLSWFLPRGASGSHHVAAEDDHGT